MSPVTDLVMSLVSSTGLPLVSCRQATALAVTTVTERVEPVQGGDAQRDRCSAASSAPRTPTWLIFSLRLGHRFLDPPKAGSLGPEPAHTRESRLLLGDLDQLASVADAVAERGFASQVAAALALVALDVGDPLPRLIALGLGHGGHEEQLGSEPASAAPRQCR